MNLSRISRQSVLGRALRLPLRLLPANLEMPVLHGPLRGARWVVGASVHGCWLGWYELEMQKLFAERVEQGSVVYDVGAHAGFYSLLASRLVGEDGLVASFEPFPPNVEVLRRHLAMNRCDNTEVLPVAVGREVGKARFAPARHTAMGSMSPDGTLSVSLTTIDHLVEAGKLRPPAVMKVDVEGAEADVLAGAERTIREHRPTLFLSTHSPALDAHCSDWLRGAGYTVSRVGTEILAHLVP